VSLELKIAENYHRVPRGPYRVPNIFLKKTLPSTCQFVRNILSRTRKRALSFRSDWKWAFCAAQTS